MMTTNRADRKEISQWPRLQEIDIREINADVGLLIGSDVPRALESREIKSRNRGESSTTRTDLGWVFNVPLRKRGNSRRTANLITADVELSKQFEKYCNMEFSDSYYDTKVTMSQEDRKALQKMKSSIQLKGGHYEIGVPWRGGCPAVPDNRSMVKNRLHHLKKSLVKEPILVEKYTAFMEDLLQKGFARQVPQHMNNVAITWLLPHHPVFHPKKPEKNSRRL